MAIELSSLTFTEQDDIVPASGVEEISNTDLANTLAGDDIITGTGKFVTGLFFEVFAGPYYYSYSINNYSGLSNAYATLNTATGNDRITGIVKNSENFYYNESHSGIINYFGTINTDDGNDTITGIIQNPTSQFGPNAGIYNRYATINTGNGNDIMTGTVEGIINDSSQLSGAGIIIEYSTIDTGDGNDTITGTGFWSLGISLNSGSTLDSGKGNDIITGIGVSGIGNSSMATFNTGEGNDIITGSANQFYGVGIYNSGSMDTGDGDDIITGTNIIGSNIIGGGYGIINDQGTINTGNGNDTITALSDVGCSNSGTINTGNGEDSIIILQGELINRGEMFLGNGNDSISVDTNSSDRAFENFHMIDTGNGNDTITSAGVINNLGVIETGNGDDSIIANAGFEALGHGGYEVRGYVSLGNGKDNLKGFGNGEFSGGDDNDTLELTSGTYTVGIWYTAVTFTKGSSIMVTSEFEKLIAGSTTYDFTSLTKGQTITVA